MKNAGLRLDRHDLLDVAPEAWAEVTRGLDLPDDAARLVADWSLRGWPVVVRRRLAGEADDALPVALQLPTAVGRLRVAASVPRAAVTRRPPVGLAEAAGSAPASWNATMSALLGLEGFAEPTVYGGLLWQHVTGEPVLRPTSDLDLLWRPEPHRRRALLDILASLDGNPVRLDGEIVLEDGGAVAWRELSGAAEGRVASIVVKTMEGVALRPVDAILRESVPC